MRRRTAPGVLLIFIAVTKTLFTNNFPVVNYRDLHSWNLATFHLCGDHIIDVICERRCNVDYAKGY